jgi:glycyl-tRNA synthetase beta chain
VSDIGGRDDARPFVQVLSTLSGLAAPIDAYFDRVLVNSTDPAVRDNRLAFLAATYALFGRFADFQRLVESGTSPS